MAEKFKFYTIIFLAILAILVWTVYLKEPDQNLHIFVLNVGQGDAILIQKSNYQLLIDGGPDDKVITQLGKVMPIEDREIEKVILTHPHADHVAGLVEVLSRYKIDKINYSGVEYDSNIYKNFLQEVKNQNISATVPKIAESESVFDQGKITFLWPGEHVQNYKDNLNNTSEVFRFDYGNFSALFPGDCETQCWQEIISGNRNSITNITLLKVSHHGSKNGTTEEILEIMKPKISVISLADKNKFGFPHKETMELLQKITADIYRTDINSTLDFITDGNIWSKK